MRKPYRSSPVVWFALLLFAAVGSVMLTLSHAATSSPAVEPESGAISGQAQTRADAGASGQQAVLFGSGGFLTRQGKQLEYQGQPYRFVGVNAPTLATCSSVPTAAQLDAYFKVLRPHSITRLWATQRASLSDIDQVVTAAQNNGQMLILSLIDGANNCNQNNQKLDAAWYQSGYTGAYFDWIRTVVARYKDSPAVGMWEIANEPGWACPGDCGLSPDQLKTFLDNSAALIKSIDPRHLVETGTMTSIAADASQQNFAYINSGPNIDVASVHEYEYDYNGNTGALYNFPKYLTGTAADDKPLIVGETGAHLMEPTNVTCRDPNETIDMLAKSKFDDYFQKGASGVLLWAWNGSAYSWAASGCINQHFFYGTTNTVLDMIRNYQIR